MREGERRGLEIPPVLIGEISLREGKTPKCTLSTVALQELQLRKRSPNIGETC